MCNIRLHKLTENVFTLRGYCYQCAVQNAVLPEATGDISHLAIPAERDLQKISFRLFSNSFVSFALYQQFIWLFLDNQGKVDHFIMRNYFCEALCMAKAGGEKKLTKHPNGKKHFILRWG
jgi:hypothetical protein